MRRAIYGHSDNHRDVAISLANLVTLLVKREQVEDGLSMVQDALSMFRNVSGAISEDPYIGQVENYIQAHKNSAREAS